MLVRNLVHHLIPPAMWVRVPTLSAQQEQTVRLYQSQHTRTRAADRDSRHTSVRGLDPPESRAGQRLNPSGWVGPVCCRSTDPPAIPSTSVMYQSLECAIPVHTVPRRPAGSSGLASQQTTRTPPSQKVCLPPRSGSADSMPVTIRNSTPNSLKQCGIEKPSHHMIPYPCMVVGGTLDSCSRGPSAPRCRRS